MNKQGMELVGVRLTSGQAQEIDSLVKKGQYPNRSEAIRDAVRVLLRMQKGIFSGMALPVDKTELIKEYAKEHGFKL